VSRVAKPRGGPADYTGEMGAMTANVLAEGQLVQLDLGAKTQVLPCRILGFGGTTVILAPVAEPEGPTVEAMHPGRDAYLMVDGAGDVRALRGRLHHAADPETIVVSVTDSFQLGQRRRYSRAPVALPARLRPAEGGSEWETVTRDISAGGVRVARTGAAGEGADALELVLESEHAGLRLQAAAAVVRRTDADLSLRFTAIEDDAVHLLQQISIAYYRLLA
jgi:hypothetical protein